MKKRQSHLSGKMDSQSSHSMAEKVLVLRPKSDNNSNISHASSLRRPSFFVLCRSESSTMMIIKRVNVAQQYSKFNM